MPVYRRYRRPVMARRRTVKWQWVREAHNNATPGNPENVNLMTSFNSQLAILPGNLPDWVLYRLHLKLAVAFTGSAQTNSGIAVACWVDSINQNLLTAQVRPYDQQFLIFDELYVGQALQQGGVTPFNIVNTYDVRARRKLSGPNNTVWLQLAPVGGVTFTNYSYILSMLMRTR